MWVLHETYQTYLVNATNPQILERGMGSDLAGQGCQGTQKSDLHHGLVVKMGVRL